MEKAITNIIEVERISHEFYCDECGEHLGTSYENGSGWYKKFGEYELRFYLNGWIRIDKCLCDKCKYEFKEKVAKTLFDIGFKKE